MMDIYGYCMYCDVIIIVSNYTTKIHAFDPDADDWLQYAERMVMFMSHFSPPSSDVIQRFATLELQL